VKKSKHLDVYPFEWIFRLIGRRRLLPVVSGDQPPPCFALAQALSGNGVFGAYLYRFRRRDTPKCTCGYREESPEHILNQCEKFKANRLSALVRATDPAWRSYMVNTVCEMWRIESLQQRKDNQA